MFLYRKIYQALKEDIQQEVYSCGMFLPTEASMAEKYGVDRTTIRKAIDLLIEDKMVERHASKGTMVIYNGKSDNDHVLWNSEGNGNRDKKNIAFLLPRGEDKSDRITIPFYAQLFYEVERYSKELGFSVFYSTMDEMDDLLQMFGNTLDRLAGIIFVSNIAEKHINNALRLRVPAVLINGYSSRIPSVASDNRRGTYLACENLIRLGHRKIGVLDGVSQYASAHARLEGVLRCFRDYKMDFNSDFLISNNGWEYKDGYEAMRRFLEKNTELPTAFICFNDRLAGGAIEAIHEKKLKIPDDISLIGYDNAEICDFLHPKLSSVETHVPSIADHAIESLYYQMVSKRLSPAKIFIPVEYIERESVRKI